ncbi:MAG TPA: hypothetical protein VGD92_09350 [Sphingobacteriaceae bacterium]
MEKLTFQTIITGELAVDIAEVEIQNQKNRSYRVTNPDGSLTFISTNNKGQYFVVGGTDLPESDVETIGRQIEARISRS